jgi:hypothetical protein
MSSAYKANIPQSTDERSVSNRDFRNNFLAINSWANTNHTFLDDNSPLQGMHNMVSFINQASDPVFAGTPEAFDIYSKLSSLTSKNELFLQRIGGPVPYEITASLAANPGWTRLCSQILIKWGTVMVAANAITITTPFPSGANIPPFTASPFAVMLTSLDGNGSRNSAPQYGLNTTATTLHISNFPPNLIVISTKVPIGFLAFGVG